MKKYLYLLLCCILAVSCGDDGGADNGGANKSIVATITPLQHADDGTVSGSSMTWSVGDKILVSDMVNASPFALVSGGGTATARFDGRLSATSNRLYGLYPAVAFDVVAGNANFEVPIMQRVGDATLMAGAAGDGVNMSFAPMLSLLRFDVKGLGNVKVRSVRMQSSKRAFAGVGSYNMRLHDFMRFSANQASIVFDVPTDDTSEGILSVVPFDMSAEERMFYEITTTAGVYTFCHNPRLDLKAGNLYNVTISASKFSSVGSLSDLEEGCFYYSPGGVVGGDDVRLVQCASTSTTATVEWSGVVLERQTYNVSLYSDVSCTNRLQHYETTIARDEDGELLPARYTFTALAPSQEYYAVVSDTQGTRSNVAKVTTSVEPNHENVVLSHGFDALCWGGDYMNMANAGLPTAIRIDHFDDETLVNVPIYTSSSDTPYEDGGAVADCSDKLLAIFGLEGWQCEDVYMRPGYMQLGNKKGSGRLRSRPIYNLLKDNVAARLQLRCAVFGAAGEKGELTVRLVGGDGVVKSSTTLSVPAYDNSPTWCDLDVSIDGVAASDCIELLSGAVPLMCDDVLLTSFSAVATNVVCGYVRDASGAAMGGVVVSDGFSAVTTNTSGYYSFARNDDAWYLYYSIPADCEVLVNEYGQPCFFERYSMGRRRYDFTLKRLAGGAEKQFALFCFADPQCMYESSRKRLLAESIPDIKSHAATLTVPSYGVTLGDVVFSGGAVNAVEQMPYMRDHFAKSMVNMPVFQVMGNHDYSYFYTGMPLQTDGRSSTTYLKAQRDFEMCFGPINYSWNRGNVHIVCMRDVIWNSDTDSGDYSIGFSDEQYEWLKQDLAPVSKDKMVILCVHIPVLNSKKKNVQNVIRQLQQFKEAHIMSGHTHCMRNEPTMMAGIYEHVLSAVCGALWNNNVAGDGTPNGYGVFFVNGTTFDNWYFKGVNNEMASRDYQMRLYRGNSVTGGSKEYFQFPYSENVILANVFNADPSWKIEIYENNVLMGEMERVKTLAGAPDRSSDNSKSEPTIPYEGSSSDWWALGYSIGVRGAKRSEYIRAANHHLYRYTLKNPAAAVRVVATDRFGRKYECSTITGGLDYSLMQR